MEILLASLVIIRMIHRFFWSSHSFNLSWNL